MKNRSQKKKKFSLNYEMETSRYISSNLPNSLTRNSVHFSSLYVSSKTFWHSSVHFIVENLKLTSNKWIKRTALGRYSYDALSCTALGQLSSTSSVCFSLENKKGKTRGGLYFSYHLKPSGSQKWKTIASQFLHIIVFTGAHELIAKWKVFFFPRWKLKFCVNIRPTVSSK